MCSWHDAQRARFDAFAEALGDSHRVLCIDLAGRGESDWLREANGYMPATYILEIRQDGEEVIEYPVIGHSPSLMVAKQIAAVTDWLRA